MRKPRPFLRLAALVAISSDKDDKRKYLVGAIAVRADGTIVSARNISNNSESQRCHAEARVLRKAGNNSYVYVARVSRTNGSLLLAKPCVYCRCELKNRKVKKCFYTISDNEYGVIVF